MNKQTLKLAIKALIFYQKSFYGWNARYDKEAKIVFDQYTDAIKELEAELAKKQPGSKHETAD